MLPNFSQSSPTHTTRCCPFPHIHFPTRIRFRFTLQKTGYWFCGMTSPDPMRISSTDHGLNMRTNSVIRILMIQNIGLVWIHYKISRKEVAPSVSSWDGQTGHGVRPVMKVPRLETHPAITGWHSDHTLEICGTRWRTITASSSQSTTPITMSRQLTALRPMAVDSGLTIVRLLD